jgi:dihydroxy-acid dehydratase
MFHRNFLAMETEELLRANPLDGSVLIGGCDKSTPGLLMGAFSMNLPAIYVPCGPMIRGLWQGNTLGSGSDVWKYWDEKRAGNLSQQSWCEIEDGIARSPGHCMTMGTASTMTAMAEVLGLTLPAASSIPAVDSAHARMATAAGRQIVENVWMNLCPRDHVTLQSFENAITADMALGGSTNAIVHLVAMAGRLGVPLPLELFDQISSRTPLLTNLRPSGKYLMDDFYAAGGLLAQLEKMRSLLHTNCLTVNGKTLGDNISGSPCFNDDVIRNIDTALDTNGGTTVLKGNLAPNGAVIKHAAVLNPSLLQHTGPALVFENYNDLKIRLDDPDLEVTPQHILVLKNAGPVGGPGMPEWGMLPLPKKLLQQGVRDMLRISDARMSGTSYGTCVLHISPESAVGGPLALVQTGDPICLDLAQKRIDVLISAEELATRRSAWKVQPSRYTRGYGKLYVESVTQAHEGADFNFLQFGQDTPEPEIH